MPIARERLTIAGMVSAAAVAWMFCDRMLGIFEGFPLASLAIVGLLDGGTSVILICVRRSEAQRSRIVLAMLFGFGALVAFAGVASYPIGADVPHVFSATLQKRLWLHLAGEAVLAVIYVVYALNRVATDAKPPSRRFAFLTWAAGFTGFLGVVLLAFGFGDRLPLVIDHTRIFAAISAFGVPVFAVAVLGSIRCWRIRFATPLDRAVALSALAMALSVLLLIVTDYRYSVAWYSSRTFDVLAPAFVLFAIVRSLVESNEHLEVAELTLAETVLSSAKRAARIRALWQIATSDALSDADHTSVIMQMAADHIRPGMPICACLLREDGSEATVKAVAVTGDPGLWDAAWADIVPERRHSLGKLLDHLASTGRTTFWNEVDPAHGPFGECMGWQSLLGVPLRIGSATYFLVFASSEPMTREPFAEDDVAFAEVVAAHLTNRFYQKDQLARIRYQMEHDALTGLKNRTEFRKAVRLAAMEGEPFAIALIDLDQFREVNESAGYLIGDEILVEVAATLRSIDERDTVARLGGDDFGVFLPSVASDEDLAGRVRLYARAFGKPFHTGDREGAHFVHVSCSIGCSKFPGDARGADEMMQHADVALDSAKSRGGGATIVYDNSLASVARERQLQRAEMLMGFEERSFVIEYQPTFDLNTRRLIGAEALVRWNHPTRGRIGPVDFISFAERNGLMGRLTRYVVDQVIADVRDVELPEGFRCYINLPARLLDDAAFVLGLEEHLRAVPGLASHLGIEITESDAMQNVEQSIQSLQMVRRLGLRVAIDDFGTGYSSMSYLKRLPIDVIKIDRSFVTGLPHDAKDAALADLCLVLCSQLGFTSLAEGIETEAQLTWLRDHGCHLGQGFLVAKPLPRERFLETIAACDRTPFSLPAALSVDR